MVPVNRPCLRRRFASRLAPAGEVHLVFVGACLQANGAGQSALPQATIRQQAGSYRGAASCLCGSLPASEWCRSTGLASGDDSPAGRLLQGKEERKRFVPVIGHCLRRRFASRLAPTNTKTRLFPCRSLPASESCGATGVTSGDPSPAGWLLQGKEERKRFVPVIGPCLRRPFASRLAPTKTPAWLFPSMLAKACTP